MMNTSTSIVVVVLLVLALETVTAFFVKSKTASRSPPFDDVPVFLQQPDYLITDSLQLEQRPNLSHFLFSTNQNKLGVALVGVGAAIAACNLVGRYDESYVHLQMWAVSLAVAAAVLDFQDSRSPYHSIVSPNVRCGVIDDAVVRWYSASYTLSTAWLAWRTSTACPDLLVTLDGFACPLAIFSFSFSLAAPLLTLFHHYRVADFQQPLQWIVALARGSDHVPATLPTLSDTELFRAQSLLAIGTIACIFAPEALALLLKGQTWWLRVDQLYPGLPWVESTNALFGVFATQASMVAHRAGKVGVAPYRTVIVPVFTVICILLTILPSVGSLYWWGDEISWFAFYTE